MTNTAHYQLPQQSKPSRIQQHWSDAFSPAKTQQTRFRISTTSMDSYG